MLNAVICGELCESGFFFFKQKTAYERRISDWSSDVCSSDLVLVMGVGVLGHIAQRAAGTRWGLPLAGFFAGFVSSTAAVAGYGAVVRQQPGLAASAASAALLSNLASLLLMAVVVAAVSPPLLIASALPLTGAGVALLIGALRVFRAKPARPGDQSGR